jgi:hypothetical protein
MSFAKLNGGVVHYLDEGWQDGPALVFINALGCDLRIWDEVAGILRHDFRLVRYDKRGHGLSESGPNCYNMADYAGDLESLLDRLGVARATIVGPSIGGLRNFIVSGPRASPRWRSATRRQRSETTNPGTPELLRSNAAELKQSRIPFSNAGSPPIFACAAPTS